MVGLQLHWLETMPFNEGVCLSDMGLLYYLQMNEPTALPNKSEGKTALGLITCPPVPRSHQVFPDESRPEAVIRSRRHCSQWTNFYD